MMILTGTIAMDLISAVIAIVIFMSGLGIGVMIVTMGIRYGIKAAYEINNGTTGLSYGPEEAPELEQLDDK